MKKTFKDYWLSLPPLQKAELARRAETSNAYLSQVANSHRNAGWRTIQKLIRADPNVTLDMFTDKTAA